MERLLAWRRFPHSCWQMILYLHVYDADRKSALADCPEIPSPTHPSYQKLFLHIITECELCFFKAMVGIVCQKKNKTNNIQVLSSVLFPIKSVPVSLTKKVWIYAITNGFFDHAIRHCSWTLVKAEKGFGRKKNIYHNSFLCHAHKFKYSSVKVI